MVRAVIDTDPGNEIDDQFALTYASLSPGTFDLQAIYAAPFHNERSSGPAHGMERSYSVLREMGTLFGWPHDHFLFRGSDRWMTAPDDPVESPAAKDLIQRAHAMPGEPLYVIAIGAITNVASAIALDPSIVGQIVVVWLGGNPTSWHHTREFNLSQDPIAARLVFDSGVPMVHVPCINVAEHLRVSLPDVERFVAPHGPIGRYLAGMYENYYDEHFGRSKEIWDIAPFAWLVNLDWVETVVVHSPVLTDGLTWSHDPARHLIREARSVQRDSIFRDFYRKLSAYAENEPTK
jgi:inosine-uridine nucleoside N-ribohydrolase